MKRSKKKAISLVSGVVARSRAVERPHVKGDKGKARRLASTEKAYLYRSLLNTALLEARSRISAQEIEGFFGDVKKLTAFENARFAGDPVEFTYLRQMEDVKARTLKFELSWLTERVLCSADQLNNIIKIKNGIEQLVLRGRYEQALIEMDSLEAVHGASLWSLSLRVAVLQSHGGDEAQKDYVSVIRTRYPKAILPFYMRHLSERAELSVPIGWYLENVQRRVDRFREDDLKIYLKFKALEEWPTETSSIAAILRVEQNHHVLDIYETFLSCIQHLVTTTQDKVLRKQIVQIADKLSEIRDFRIEKISLLLGANPRLRDCAIDGGQVSCPLLSGHPRTAYRVLRKQEEAEHNSGFTMILHAMALSVVENLSAGIERKHVNLHERVAVGLASTTKREDTLDDSVADEAKKIGNVYSALPSCAAIKYFQKALAANSTEQLFRWLTISTANCEHLSFLDVASSSSSVEIAGSFRRYLHDTMTDELSQILLQIDTAQVAQLDEGIAGYAMSCAAHNAGRFDDVEATIERALESPSSILRNSAAVIALSAYGANGNYPSAAQLISKEVAVEARPVDSLPVQLVFADAGWRDLAPYSEDIAMSNSLAALSDIEPTDDTRTNRIFALQRVLKKAGFILPSELKELAKGVRRQEFIYFLQRACSMDVLDMLDSLKSSMAVLGQRRDIYSALLEIDPDHAVEYRYQILSISKEIKISQGLKTIDATRVHVDAQALRSILRRDLTESFSRYLQLTKDGDASSDSFDEILRDLTKPDQLAKHLLFPKQSEADDLLFTMIGQARDRFLFNVPHGLDSYLSKRVRHGSIVGHLRAPAEAEGMITQQDGEGRYKENTRWGHAISLASNPTEMQKAFLSFARSLDQHLLRLKDVLLHVRSEDKPLGLFDLRIQPIQYRLIRSVAIQDRTLDAFLETMMGTLRGLLNNALVGANAHILQDTSRHIDGLFQQLRATVDQQLSPCDDRMEIISAINRASASVHAAVTSAANWFSPTTVEDVKFTMEDAFEIAISSVISIVPEFDPSVDFDDDSGLLFTVHELPFMQDVLFVALGNVAKHSQIDAPAVEVQARYSLDRSLLTIEVTNDIGPKVNLVALKAHLAGLKPKLRTPEYQERARSEGNSGIPKLASTVFQSEYGELDFDVTAQGRFWLSFTLSINSER